MDIEQLKSDLFDALQEKKVGVIDSVSSNIDNGTLLTLDEALTEYNEQVVNAIIEECRKASLPDGEALGVAIDAAITRALDPVVDLSLRALTILDVLAGEHDLPANEPNGRTRKSSKR